MSRETKSVQKSLRFLLTTFVGGGRRILGVARGCFFYKINIFQKEGRCHENKEKKVFLSTVYVNSYFLYCSAGTLKRDNTVSYGQC